MLNVFRDEGDSGGTGAGAESSSTPDQDQGQGSDQGSPSGDAGGGNAGQGNDAGSQNANWESRFTEMETNFKELQTRYDQSQSKLGDLTKTMRTIHEDPNTFIENLVSKTGAKWTPAKPESSPEDDLNKALSGDSGQIDKATLLDVIQRVSDAKVQDALKVAMPVVNTIQEEALARKYETWDADADERMEMATLSATGQISEQELLQLATQGKKMPQVMKDFEVEIRAKVEAEYAQKLREQISGGGMGSPGEAKVPEGMVPAETTAAALNEVR